MMKIYFEAHGCSMNYGEARIMEDIVSERHEIVDSFDDADILVLVTCVVIESTERRMINRIKEFCSTGKKLVVAGCMASAEKEKIKKIAGNAKILPPDEFCKILEMINGTKNYKTKLYPYPPKRKENRVDAIIPISSGCLGKCSFCITKIARRNLKSYPMDNIGKCVERAVNLGYKEIRITAQDTGAYGKDIGETLPELINNLTKIHGDFKLRIGMMNPDTVLPMLDELLDSYSNEKVFRFLHLPVQSGDDEILQKMGRNYSADDFRYIVRRFRKAFNDVTLSTDIIAGFPAETSQQFQKSCELIKETKPDIVNVKAFSPRPKTKAYAMKRLDSKIVKGRTKKISKLRLEISKKNLESFVGRKEKILTTEFGKNNTVVGRTNAYRPVVIKDKIDLGRFVDIKITDSGNTYLKGIIK
ncbi:MAG: threonylcarbamoyladenosine tRNA methylthiotransferase [Euryarchaeota archaeon CG_4_9_14_3_um_filter_38_12]|nr:MAG: threonylcarbamoyladenosine tRNA methylthiotransferase [Euryarchaeota archaeon CG_4_9_14_3_um_filter_38_12]